MSEIHNELVALKGAAEKMPPPQEIGRIIRLVRLGAPFDQFFFEKLNDPAWLPILSRHGYFSNLPGIETIEGGRQTYPYHLPLIALSNLAAKAPQAVTSILAKLELPENPTVGDQVLRCVASIREPTCIPILHPLLVQLGEKPNHSSWVWIQELLKNWIEIKAYSDVLFVTNSYLLASVSSINNSSPLRDEWLVEQVDSVALEQLTSTFPLQIATIVFNALSSWAEQKRNEEAGEKQTQSTDVEMYLGEDFPFCFWLEDFKTKPSYRELEGTLACRLFAAAEQVYRQGEIDKIELLDQLLRSNSWELFQRLRWQLYADFPTLSLERARKDVLERIPFMNRVALGHNFELAQLLQVHSKKSGEAFLSFAEVGRLFDAVLSGPIDKAGELIEDNFREVFRRKQLWPISSLLRGEQLTAYNLLCPDSDKIDIQSYKPFRSGGEAHFVEHISPAVGNNLAAMSEAQLWEILNNWQPAIRDWTNVKWWVQEDIGALATKFAELLEKEPARFLPATQWWKNLNRPEPLIKPLERATENIKKKQNENPQISTENDWSNWFGIAKWIIAQSSLAKTNQQSNEQGRQPDWYWPRTVVANFLNAAIQSQYPTAKKYNADVIQLLKTLVEEEDSQLQSKEDSAYDDWLTIAINTVRGHAIEGILELALRQKEAKEEIQPWIFELICSRLNLPEESPAIFALLGSRLRLFIHLFKEDIKRNPNMLFPLDRPSHQKALIVSHFCFDHPMTDIIETFPDFLDKALSTMENILEEKTGEKSKQKPRDFASQLGIHIGFYFWNNAFPNYKDGEATLDRFFALAHEETRAFVIGQIAWIFEKVPVTNDKDSEMRYERVMRLWERRYSQIVAKMDSASVSDANYEGELVGFIRWLGCECFPFDWRLTNVLQAINRLKKSPDVFHLFENLYKWNDHRTERLNASLQILAALLVKPSDKLRWGIQPDKLSPLLVKGLASNSSEIKARAAECQDLLLKLGFFAFLDLESK